VLRGGICSVKVPDPQIILDERKTVSTRAGRMGVVPLSFTPATVPSPRRVGDLCWRRHERMKLL
jgi:hypothetical protein